MLFPHAELRESRSFVIKWDADLERVDISFRVLWEELMPTLPADVVANVSEVRIPGNWTVDASDVEVLTDAGGFSVRIVDAQQSGWAKAPIIEVLAPGYAPEEVSFFSPKFISDETVNRRESGMSTVEALDRQIDYLETEIAEAEAAIADPNTINQVVVIDIAETAARIEELAGDIAAGRYEVAVRWDAASAAEQLSAANAIKGLVTAEQETDLAWLRSELQTGPVAASDLAESIADIALAGLLISESETSHAFYLMVEERQQLLVVELPSLKASLQQANEQAVRDYMERRDAFSKSLEEAKALRKETQARLNRIERAPWLTLLSSKHEPYTR